MRNFKIGDGVRIVGSFKGSPHVGKMATIVGHIDGRRTDFGEPGWFVDLPSTQGTTTGLALFADKHLAHYYDGAEPVAWSECAWQPNKVSG